MVVDLESLEKSFNLDEIKYECKSLRNRIKNLENFEDPTHILQSNIERASALLDRLEEEMDNGVVPKGGTARMFEVASTLINSITTAAASMMSLTFGNQDSEYKNKVLTLKELEINAKIAGKSPQQSLTQNNNIILTDRNALLELLSKSDDPLTIDTTEIKEL